VKKAGERGRWGTWLRQERLRRNLSAEQVRAMLAKQGYRVGESTYAEWESGYKKQPARDAQPLLIAMWGSEPPAEPEHEVDATSIVGALREIVAELGRIREAQEETAETLGAVLGLAARLLPGGLPASLVDEVLDGTPK
jgi:hypothetical protein